MDTESLTEESFEKIELERQSEARTKIFRLEDMLASLPGAMIGDSPECPLKHDFADGIYMRQIRIPKGTVLTGKIHRHRHPNVLLSGECIVYTEGRGPEHLKAPLAMISEPGTKRAIYAMSDLHWITFHNVGDERDLAKIEDWVIAPTYAQLEREKIEELCPG
jgi:hypothetical protein